MLRRSLHFIRSLGIFALIAVATLAITSVASHATSLHIGPIASSTVISKADAAIAGKELTAGKAVVLGLVEGITEYLPVSSTGHLLITERLLHIGDKAATKDAADTYTVVIQAGAILAVLVLFWKRILDVLKGVVGKSEEGRNLLVVLVLSFIPAAILGLAGEHKIKSHLLKPIPVSIAWILGALAILFVGSRLHQQGKTIGRAITEITYRDAVIIGCAQALALWPGTSRSLVTILAALALGISLQSAVEYSFLLGILALGAATAKDLLSNGKQLTDVYGTTNPMIGFVVAFIAALIAVRWLLSYLQRHDLKVFAWYRLAAAATTIALVASNTIK